MSNFYVEGFRSIKNMAADKLGIHPEFITVVQGDHINIKINNNSYESYLVSPKSDMVSEPGEAIEDDNIIIELVPSIKDPNRLSINEVFISTEGNIEECVKFMKHTNKKLKELNAIENQNTKEKKKSSKKKSTSKKKKKE